MPSSPVFRGRARVRDVSEHLQNLECEGRPGVFMERMCHTVLSMSRPHGLFDKATSRSVRHQARPSNRRRALHMPLKDFPATALNKSPG